MNTTSHLVNTTKALEYAARELSEDALFFIDTEFEQQSGQTTLCLIQISAGRKIFLIDALRLSAMQSLVTAITSPTAEWVLHAGQTDIELLLGKFDLDQPPRIFDTQVAWGLLGAEYYVSLPYLNYKVLDRRTEKEHQADYWDQRPLTESQLAYAASDIETLPLLRQRLLERLKEQGKQKLVYDVSQEMCCPSAPEPQRRRTVSISDFRNAWQLDYGGRAALHFLIDWWNGDVDDRPPAELKPYALFSIARRLPESGEELAKLKGVPSRWARRHGDLLTGRLIRASYEANEQQYSPIEPKPYLTFEEVRVDAFLSALRYAVSRAISMAPEICFPSWLLQDQLREHLLQSGALLSGVDVFEGWRREWLVGPYIEFCRNWQQVEPQ